VLACIRAGELLETLEECGGHTVRRQVEDEVALNVASRVVSDAEDWAREK
jgi:hypothetical protein